MLLLTTVTELLALDLGMQAVSIRKAQAQADADRKTIEELTARCASLAAAASEVERSQQTEVDPNTETPQPENCDSGGSTSIPYSSLMATPTV